MRTRAIFTTCAALTALWGCAAEVAGPDAIDSQSAELRRSDPGGTDRGGKPKSTSVVLDADAIHVAQLDFVGLGMSAWGALTIDPLVVARQSGVEAGFLSVRTGDGWVVHNLPIQSRPEDHWPQRILDQRLPPPSFVPPIRAYFNIGTERRLATLDLVAVFTSEPLASERDLAKWERARLVPFEVATTQHTEPTGVSVPPPDGLPPAPPEPPPFLAPEPYDPGLGVQGWYTVSLPSQDNVETAWNQCVPAAYANALAYLETTFGLNVPHPHVPGINGPSLVGILDFFSQRSVTDECTGGPTAYCFLDDTQTGIVNSLYRYLNTNGLEQAVDLEHQGIPGDYPGSCAAIPYAAPVSTASGAAVTVPWIRDHLEAGDAVVLAFDRLTNTINGEVKTSGHMLRIYGYSEVNGQAFLMALDDQAQDSAGNNNFCISPNNTGLTWETWAVGDSDNDGTLNKGLNNLREITFAMAIGVK